MVQVVGPPTSAHGSEGAYCIPVRLQGSEHLVLLDSGAMQTLIQQSLVRPEALVGTPWVSISCVHGDVHKYPIVPVEIYYQGKIHKIKAAVSSRLSHPLMLGTDWAGFNQVTKDLVGVRSRWLGKCEVCAAGSGDVGSADAVEREPMSKERSIGTPSTPEFYPMEDFPLEQSRDDTLRFAFEQVKSIDGQLVHPDTAPSHPYFSIIKENWEEGPSPSKNEIQYVIDLRAKLHTLGQLSRENLLEAQERQQRLYNRGTKLRQFSPGDKVLVLLPTSSTKLIGK